jgi:hypothetical protein
MTGKVKRCRKVGPSAIFLMERLRDASQRRLEKRSWNNSQLAFYHLNLTDHPVGQILICQQAFQNILGLYMKTWNTIKTASLTDT